MCIVRELLNEVFVYIGSYIMKERYYGVVSQHFKGAIY